MKGTESQTALVIAQSTALVRKATANLAKRGLEDQVTLETANELFKRSAEGLKRNPQNPQNVEWLRQAADLGLMRAQDILGMFYKLGTFVLKDNSQAEAWYRKAADQGSRNAQRNLGMMNYQGQGVPKDYTQAAKWFYMAASQGCEMSQQWLGFLYSEGKGVPIDGKQAEEWYRKAAASGYSGAELDVRAGIVEHRIDDSQRGA